MEAEWRMTVLLLGAIEPGYLAIQSPVLLQHSHYAVGYIPKLVLLIKLFRKTLYNRRYTQIFDTILYRNLHIVYP